MKPRLMALIAVVLAAAATRLIPHPPNMTAIGAVALFGGAYFRDRRLAFAVPLAALFLSDLVLGLHSGMALVYLSFAMTVAIGLGLRTRRRPAPIVSAALLSAVLFFVVTNLGVWVFGTLYPQSWTGLTECYLAALPFFRNEVAGDLLYTGLLFGGFAALERNIAFLREPDLRLATA